MRNRFRSALFVFEVALCFVLLTGAGLMLRTLARLFEVNPGFQSARVMTVDLSLPAAKYKDASEVEAYLEEVFDRLDHLPGVESTGAINYLPLAPVHGLPFLVPVSTHSHPLRATGVWENAARVLAISGNYFQTLRIPLLRGRHFGPRDFHRGVESAIVDENFARHFWPGRDPIGKSFQGYQDFTVVGEVGNVRQASLGKSGEMEFYVPLAEHGANVREVSVVVRLRAGSAISTKALGAGIVSVDPDEPVPPPVPMADILQNSVSSSHSLAVLLGDFAALALLLAGIGCYGVIASTVSHRTHEIGIRMALGAKRSDVMRLVLWRGAGLIVGGLALGVGSAFALTRLMASLLYGVRPTDPASYGGAAGLLALVALAACWIPARRAMKVDPTVALRHE